MIELTVVSADHPWRKFMVDVLKSGEVTGKKGKPVEFTYNFMNAAVNPGVTPDSLVASEANQKHVIITHPGLGNLAEALREKEFSVFGGGAIADAIQNNPDFATLQAVKQRLLITGDSGGEDFVLCSTAEGLVGEWIPIENHIGLIPGLVKTREGVTLKKPVKPVKHRKEVHEKLEALCKSWDYRGFLFISDLGDGTLGYLRTFGPEAFLPAFCHAMKTGALKFFMKANGSRNCIPKFGMHCPTTAIKATLPPYPYNRCPWVKDPTEKEITERCLNMGGVGAQFVDAESGVIWMNVDENMKSTGAEVAILLYHLPNELPELLGKIDPSGRLQYKKIGK